MVRDLPDVTAVTGNARGSEKEESFNSVVVEAPGKSSLFKQVINLLGL